MPDAQALRQRPVGDFHSRSSTPARSTNTSSSAPMASFCRSRPIPFGFEAELRPSTASVVADSADFRWTRRRTTWRKRARGRAAAQADVDLRGPSRLVAARRRRTFSHLRRARRPADPLCRRHGLHPSRAPADQRASARRVWGYQPIGLFAPTRRFGEPAGFARFVDRAHRGGARRHPRLGAGAFPDRRARPGALRRHRALRARRSAQGLPSRLEHRDLQFRPPRGGELPLSPTRSSGSTASISTGCASMPSPRCSTSTIRAREGEWLPNQDGSKENREAVAFLRRANELVYGCIPGRHDDRRGIRPPGPAFRGRPMSGGLGFGFKWNMGWMHDTLDYMARDPVHRRWTTTSMTFGLLYAFSENFVLPLSHDEVVHGKGSLVGKMPGDDWQRFANLRAYLRLHVGLPGQEAPVHGPGVRPDEGMERRRVPGLVAARSLAASGRAGAVRDLNHALSRNARRSTPATASPRASAGSSSTTTRSRCSPSCGAARRAIRRSWSSATSRRCRATTIASACPTTGHWREVLNSDAPPTAARTWATSAA